MLPLRTVVFLASLLAFTAIPTIADDDPALKVTPPNKAVEPGTDVTFQCTYSPENPTDDLKLQWFMPGYNVSLSQLLQNATFVNKTRLPSTSNETDILESRYSVVNGTLTIKHATLDDAMTFVCKSPDGKLSKETLLKVYVMPTYFMEGMIVVGINMGLIAIFILCSIYSFVKERRERRENQETRRKHKLGHREVAKKILAE